MNKKILVTGGAGFIGSALIRNIISNTNHSVVNIDKLTYAGNLESLSLVESSDRYSFELADICDPNKIKNIFEKHQPDLIIHLAAESHVDKSINTPSEFIQTNIIGTYVLLEQSRMYWGSLENNKKDKFRFLHVSTDEVYGDLEGTNDLFTETTRYAPSSPYSASKASSDHLVRAWNRTYKLPTLITNCSNNYGPYQFPEKLLPKMITNILNNKNLPIYAKGKNSREWIHVEDHCEALFMLYLKGKSGESYNVGSGVNVRNIDLVKKILKLSKEMNIKIGKKTKIVFVKDRPGHDFRYALNSKKIFKKLKWKSKINLNEGLRKTIDWYFNNKIFLKNISKKKYEERLGLNL